MIGLKSADPTAEILDNFNANAPEGWTASADHNGFTIYRGETPVQFFDWIWDVDEYLSTIYKMEEAA